MSFARACQYTLPRSAKLDLKILLVIDSTGDLPSQDVVCLCGGGRAVGERQAYRVRCTVAKLSVHCRLKEVGGLLMVSRTFCDFYIRAKPIRKDSARHSTSSGAQELFCRRKKWIDKSSPPPLLVPQPLIGSLLY